jgi:predicted MFS family arabinose efflux permease
MSTIDTRRGQAVLIACHVAGMIDMVALPIWVGTLVQRYGFNAQQAGGLVTLFLGAVVVASVLLGPRFDHLPRRWIPSIGYGITALAFLGASYSHGFAVLAAFHVLGGLGVGCGLSITHGTMGRTGNPSRAFAYAQTVLGLFAVVFLGVVPRLITALGGPVMFYAFVCVMVVAVVFSAVGFPVVKGAAVVDVQERRPAMPLSLATWCAIAGVVLLIINQSMMFSFFERIGHDRNFGADNVNAVLLSIAIITLFPSAFAAMLQRRLSARTVALAAPWVQAALGLTVTNAGTFVPYAVAGALYPFVTIFAHTFLFGLIARLDRSGRASASMPAMMMSGSAIGPFLAGTLVLNLGYPSVGIGIAVVAAVSTLFVSRIPHASSSPESVSIGIMH